MNDWIAYGATLAVLVGLSWSIHQYFDDDFFAELRTFRIEIACRIADFFRRRRRKY